MMFDLYVLLLQYLQLPISSYNLYFEKIVDRLINGNKLLLYLL